MEFQVNKSSEFPIYQQLKEQIKYFLLSGVLQPGTRVPPPKDLASYLQINRNTVIAAYKELEKEGLLMTRHGQGTYISEKLPPLPDEERKQALINLVRDTLERTVELGFSTEDLFTVVFNQAVLGIGSPRRKELRTLLVECNRPDLEYFQQEMQKELGIRVDGCLLAELPDKVQDEAVTAADFVVTTFFHLEDVKAILEPLGKEVMAIMAAPHLHTFMRIAQLPPGTRVGIVCGSKDGSLNMKKALESAGIENVKLANAGLDDRETLQEMLNRVDVVVASR
ncbi:GntR family transcriptional regulator, partial [bacterium]